MQRLVRCGSFLLLLLAFIVPTFAGDEPKKKVAGDDKKTDTKKGDDPETTKPKKEVKEKFVFGKKYVGKITQMDANAAAKDFTLKVTWKIQELNPQAQQQLAQQQQQYANHQRAYAFAQNIQAKQRAMQQMQQSVNQMTQTQRNLYRVKDMNKDFKFRVAEKCVFRILTPEPEYDDKGNPVEFKKEDLVRLKGNLKIDYPGYKADADALRNNLTVAVYTPKIDPAPKGEKKKKLDDDDVVVSDRPEVILVIIQNQVIAARK